MCASYGGTAIASLLYNYAQNKLRRVATRGIHSQCFFIESPIFRKLPGRIRPLMRKDPCVKQTKQKNRHCSVTESQRFIPT